MGLRDSSFKFMQFVQSLMSLGGVNCKQQEALDLPLTPGTVVFRGVRVLIYVQESSLPPETRFRVQGQTLARSRSHIFNFRSSPYSLNHVGVP